MRDDLALPIGKIFLFEVDRVNRKYAIMALHAAGQARVQIVGS